VEVNVATIDTMLSFYLAFIYAEEYMPFKDRILCMAKFLFQVEEENKLEQKGLLKRFSLNCVGKQPSLEDIRAEKAEKFKELANKRGSSEYEEWFLKYNPSEKKDGKKPKNKKEEMKEPIQAPEKEKESEQEPEPKSEKKEENNKIIASLITESTDSGLSRASLITRQNQQLIPQVSRMRVRAQA
jgi:outer membrane biosynthesis protein TonB